MKILKPYKNEEQKTEMEKQIDHFNFEILDKYKEITLDIQADATLTKMFQKKDYSGMLKRIKEVKKDALLIDVMGMEIHDADEKALRDLFDKALYRFNTLCDAQIEFQTLLYNKSTKKAKVSFAESRLAARKVNEKTALFQTAAADLDAIYADFLEEH